MVKNEKKIITKDSERIIKQFFVFMKDILLIIKIIATILNLLFHRFPEVYNPYMKTTTKVKTKYVRCKKNSKQIQNK